MYDKYFVVDQDGAIHKEGTEEECKAFISAPETNIVAEFGGFDLMLVRSEDLKRGEYYE